MQIRVIHNIHCVLHNTYRQSDVESYYNRPKAAVQAIFFPLCTNRTAGDEKTAIKIHTFGIDIAYLFVLYCTPSKDI